MTGCANPRLTTHPQFLAALVTGKPGTVLRNEVKQLWCSGAIRANSFFMQAEYQLPHCVYVLLSLKDHNFYVGYTTELSRRLDEHFQGRNTSTAPRRPFRLLHCEYYLAKVDAERRETYLKTAKGRRTLRLMLKDSLADLQPEQGLKPELSQSPVKTGLFCYPVFQEVRIPQPG